MPEPRSAVKIEQAGMSVLILIEEIASIKHHRQLPTGTTSVNIKGARALAFNDPDKKIFDTLSAMFYVTEIKQ